MKRHTIGLKELREHTETYIKRVQKGESLTIMRRNEPIFRMTPADAADDAGWETVVDFTKIRAGGVPLTDVRAAIRRILAA
jgi:prevent-host-death family protein